MDTREVKHKSVVAVYEGGVLHPLELLPLEEHARVEVSFSLSPAEKAIPTLKGLQELLDALPNDFFEQIKSLLPEQLTAHQFERLVEVVELLDAKLGEGKADLVRRREWMRAQEPSFAAAWDNDADAVYDSL